MTFPLLHFTEGCVGGNAGYTIRGPGKVIGEVYPHADSLKYARLFVFAPRLLEALEKIVAWAPETDPTDRGYDDMEGAEAYGGDLCAWDIAQEIKSLVAQAKGEKP